MKSPGVDKSEKAEDTTNLQRCIIMPENIEEEDIRVHFPNVDIKRPPFPLTKNSRPLSDMKERRKANYVILTFPNEEAAKNVKSEIVIKQTKIEVRDRNPPQMGHAMLEFLQIVKPPLEFSSLYQLRKTGCRLKCVCGFDLAVSSIKEHLTKYHDMKFKTNDEKCENQQENVRSNRITLSGKREGVGALTDTKLIDGLHEELIDGAAS